MPIGKAMPRSIGVRGAADVGSHFGGSDLLLVQAVFLQRHDASAEQVDAGAAIHRSLEGLQFVDLSFGLPRCS